MSFQCKNLAPLGYVVVHFFAGTMVLYSSLTFWISYVSGTNGLVSQSSFIFSMERLKVEFVPDNRYPKMCQTEFSWNYLY